MKKYLLILILWLIPFFNLMAQNFVTNGDFDTYTIAPTTYAQVCYATGWKSPNNLCSLNPGNGSPDYYNINGLGGAKPPTTWWANVSPHSGTGFEGFACYYSGANYREYIQRPLSGPLTPGVTYHVSFWVTNGISTLHYWGVKELGLYFSVGAVTQTAGAPILVTPQVELTSVFYSTTWTQFTFTFTPLAAYDWVTIGNFHNDAGTTKSLFGPNLPSSYGAYYYIDDISVIATAPLPVTWLNFEGNFIEKEGVELNWSTASEENCDHYEIQRSSNGSDYETIGVVTGNGTTSEISKYSFTDKYFQQGIVYYRLKEIDFNGESSISKTIAVSIDVKTSIIFPQPVKNILFIQGNLPKTDSYSIIDMQGRIVKTLHYVELGNGIDVESLSGGIYQVIGIASSGQFPVGKFVKY
jgi:hypothetical protein